MNPFKTALVLFLAATFSAAGFSLSSAAPAPPPAAPAAAQAAAPAAAPATAQGPSSGRSAGDRNYILAAGDTIQITALGHTDFDTKAPISTDGTILLPYLGALPAMGRSPAQLAEDVRLTLEKSGIFAQPLVRVDLISSVGRSVTVLGAVGAPGVVSLDREYRLSEVLARAGGRSATGADYVMLTREDGTAQKYLLADLATGAAGADPIVAPRDKVFVPALENEVFYLSGQVKTPGAYPVTRDMTVRMALARGGGVSDLGSEKKVKIVRAGKPLDKVAIDETKIAAGDVVTVGARLF